MASSLGFTKSFADGKMKPRERRRATAKTQTPPPAAQSARADPIGRSQTAAPEVTPRAVAPKTADASKARPQSTSSVEDVDVSLDEGLHNYETDDGSHERLDRETPRGRKFKLRFKFGKFPRMVPVEEVRKCES